MKKAMHNTDKQYIRSSIYQVFTSDMHILKTNSEKIFNHSMNGKPINHLIYALGF
jgi:hypothetical protein